MADEFPPDVDPIAFPVLERDLDYIINHFLPYEQGVVSEQILSISASGAAEAALSAASSYVFVSVPATSIDVDILAAAAHDFEINSRLIAELAADATSQYDFAFESTGAADNETPALHDIVFDVLGSGDGTNVTSGSSSVDLITLCETSVEIAISALAEQDLPIGSSQVADLELDAASASDILFEGSAVSENETLAAHVDTFSSTGAGEATVQVGAIGNLDFTLISAGDGVVSVDADGAAVFMAVNATTTLVDISGSSNWTFGLKPSTAVAVGVVGGHSSTISFKAFQVARNTAYNASGLLNHPAWPFEPNWSSSVSETLEWLTDIMTSPTGSEQRRSLRFKPRRSFEYSVVASGDERSLLDNLLISFGAQRWWAPVWYDVNITTAATQIGAVFIPCPGMLESGIQTGDGIFIAGDSVYDGFVHRVGSITAQGVHLDFPLEVPLSRGTRLFPVVTARLQEQPRLTKLHDALVSTEVRFQVLDPNDDADEPAPGLDTYLNFMVMPTAPEEDGRIELGFERTMEELDNKISIPQFRDTAGRSFNVQKHAWSLNGRAEHRNFKALLNALRGRAVPIWLPTFMLDFKLTASVAAGSSNLVVGRCGFTQSGGPRWDREHIMIETDTGRLYRKIVTSAIAGDGTEILNLDQPLPAGLQMHRVFRICFITLVRQNQDSVEIEHMTDIDGISSVQTTFRSAPDTRTAAPAF